MFAVKDLDEKREVVRARRGEPELIDGRDLLFHGRAQIFFAERGRALKLDRRCFLRVFLLRFGDGLLLFLFLIRPHHRDDALRAEFGDEKKAG